MQYFWDYNPLSIDINDIFMVVNSLHRDYGDEGRCNGCTTM